jgi:hypothetical protein
MKERRTSHASEPIGAPARCETNLPRLIPVVDGCLGILESSAEVLIRHETKFSVENSSIIRKLNQAGNAAAECQLQNLPICPTSHN